MTIKPTIFRAFDIRGIYPQELNEAVAKRVASALLKFQPKIQTVVVALDTRKSSPSLAKAVNEILVRAGRKAIFLGVAPDPLFYFSIFHYGFDGGIMISGSHNPPQYNGLMLHLQGQGDLAGRDLEKIRRLANQVKEPKSNGIGQIIKFNPIGDYLKAVTQKISLRRPLKILIDSGNGAMGYLPQKVFEKLGCQVKTLYGEFDGSFPHHLPDPYERKNRLAAKTAVLKGKFDLGFVYDGDGDRVAVIDNRGRSVLGDFCFLMLTRQALAKERGPIVHDLRVSQVFLDEMKRQGIRTYFSVSHHTAVIKKIQEVKAIFGGEATLHFLFPLDWYLCDEALFASLKLAEIASQKKDFAAFIDTLPRYAASPEIFLPCDDEKKFLIIKKLQNYLRKNNHDFVDIDGARINFPHGWALARAANTTPFIKCRFEGKTPADLKKIKKESLAIFQKVGFPLAASVRRDLGSK
jgi:phosphomannomutase/phosphoglucomutase